MEREPDAHLVYNILHTHQRKLTALFPRGKTMSSDKQPIRLTVKRPGESVPLKDPADPSANWEYFLPAPQYKVRPVKRET